MKRALTSLKRIVAVLVIFCLVFSLIPANTFAVAASDISGHWAQVKIQSWIDKGLIKGYPDGTFKPDQNVTRAEFMTLANRAFGYTTVVPITYTDVKAGSWYAPEVAKAKAAGYISGYPDGTMRPENPITREEVATIVARIKNLTSDANAADKYSDASKIGSWSKGQVGAVTSAKIMQGYPDGSFKPQGLMTRAEVVVASDNALYYTTPVANIAVSAITVTPTTMALTAGGATGAITATVGPSKATNKIVTWSSSNAAVATVAGGVVTPVAAGAAVITATTAQGSFTATCTVTVTAPAPAPATYTVTFDSQGGTPTPAAITGIASGATVTLPTAPTKTGYTFASWNTVAVGGGTTFDASTHVTANVTVYAQWTIDTFTLAYTAGANGTITGTSPQTVNYGTDGAQVTATPSTGYHFVKWSDDVATAARTDIHVTANISVTATFAIDTFTLAYTAGANGTISGTSPQIVDYGADGTEVTATPNTGYHFVKWSDDSTANPRTDTNVTGDITVSASFAANSGTITVAAGTGGSITSATSFDQAYGVAGTTITASPSAGYHFDTWTATTNPSYVTIATATDVSTTVTATSSMPATGGAATITATFAANSITVTIASAGNGTVTPTSPVTQVYGAGGTAITATPSAGYHFAGWSGTVNDTYVAIANTALASTTFTATTSAVDGGAATITATFAANSITVTIASAGNGTVTPTSPVTQVYGAGGTAITATPSAGYHFAGWSGTVNDTYVAIANTALASTTFTATTSAVDGGAATITATFAANSGTITVAAGTGGSITSATSFDQAYGVAGTTITASPSAGYHFDTWTATTNPSYVTIATATDVSTTVTATSSMPATGGAATITATFAANSITVTIASAGNGTVTPTSPVTQVYGAGGTAITATPSAGYHFAGWSGTVNDTYVAIANTALASTTFTATTSAVDGGAATITATFAANTFAVTFDGQGGTPSPASIQVTYGSTYGTLATVTRTGYTFAGWWTLASGGTQVTSASAVSITAAQTLYAQWTADNETLTFNSNSGSPVAAITQAFGTTVSAPTAPTRSGCTFVAWYNESGFETVHTFSTMGLSTIVYAQWAATVTFDKNGGDNDASPTTSTGILLYSGRATLPTTNPTWAGHTFDSWNTQADGLGTAFTAATQVIATITVYAKWLSSDATLSSGSLGGVGFLGTSAGGTDIAPSSGLTVTVPAGMEALALTPGNTKSAISFTTSTGATPVDGGYNVLYVAGAQSIDLTAFGGSSADIWVRVTAEDRTTKLYYQIIVTVSAPLKIGDPYGGGKVAYILQSGETIKDASGNVLYSYDANVQHGLIAALTDQSTGIIWAIPACQSTGVTGTLDSIGYGSANTDKIIAQNVGGGTTYAAGLARACTDGGFNDWYLPSSSDLAQLYSNRSLIGNFNNALYYWSSYQSGATAAWTTYFATGSGATELKSSTQAVRAVRNF